MKDEKIAIIIPMYNVANYIQDVLAEIPAMVDLIIAVDDRSRDNTVQLIQQSTDSRIHLLQHEQNQGVGGAMISGFQYALDQNATICIKIDGDGQMPIEYLSELIQPILKGNADFTKGNRFSEVESILNMPWIRRIGNLGLSFLTKSASGYWNTFDPTNGFFAIDGCLLKQMNLSQLHPRYFFESSLLCSLYQYRAVIEEISMPARYGNEKSSLSEAKALFEFPPLLFAKFIRRIWLRYFVMDFSIASISLLSGFILCLFGAIWGIYWWYQSYLTGIPSTTGTVIIATIPIILGFQLILHFLTIDIQNVPTKPKNQRK
jgi:glycosyltransferase involved in cell wall biosynthesis